MEFTYLLPEVSPFLTEINKVIDQKIEGETFSKLFEEPPAKKDQDETKPKVPSLSSLVTRQSVEKKFSLEQLPGAPEDIQILFLRTAKSIAEWTAVRRYCLPDTLKKHDIQILKNAGVYSFVDNIPGTSLQDKMLRHIFHRFITTCSVEVIQQLIQEDVKSKPIAKVSTGFKKGVEQVASAVAYVLQSTIVSFLMGTILWYATYRVAGYALTVLWNRVIPLVAVQIMKHVPGKVVKYTYVAYDYSQRLWWVALGLSLLAPSNSRIQNISKKFMYLVTIPTEAARQLAGLPFTLASQSRRAKELVPMAGEVLKAGVVQSELSRWQIGLTSVRERWVNEMRELKVELAPATA